MRKDLCVDCQSFFPVDFEGRKIAYCKVHTDPITGDELPCAIARIDDRFCGLDGKDYFPGNEMPKIVKSSVESL